MTAAPDQIASIRIDSYDYTLPESMIAVHPLEQRDQCRLLVYDTRLPGATPSTRIFAELPALLPPGSMLVYNNTRVINARLRFRKGPGGTGAPIEIFCLEPASPADYARNFASTAGCAWHCLVGNSKRWKEGRLTRSVTTVEGYTVTLSARRGEPQGAGWTVYFEWDNPQVTFSSIIAATGEIPIPPYLNRPTEQSDSRDYQTVYSRIDGSVAAPTAGLHFTPGVLEALDRVGIPRRELTLHVGAGTFRPVKTDTIGGHDMHCEFIAVPRTLVAELASTDRRVVAVGTTSVRTLESLYHIGCMLHSGLEADTLPQWYPYSPGHPGLSVPQAMEAVLRHLDAAGRDTLLASTQLMIAPGYTYRVVEGMVTNFHQPRSTLLLLVSAFLGDAPDGTPRWRGVYDYALARGYRFLSYGDACLLLH